MPAARNAARNPSSHTPGGNTHFSARARNRGTCAIARAPQIRASLSRPNCSVSLFDSRAEADAATTDPRRIV